MENVKFLQIIDKIINEREADIIMAESRNSIVGSIIMALFVKLFL